MNKTKQLINNIQKLINQTTTASLPYVKTISTIQELKKLKSFKKSGFWIVLLDIEKRKKELGIFGRQKNGEILEKS